MIKDAGRKVFLILDNLRVHHSKPVKAWAAERQDKIQLFYLPSYSPELNPEERLNGDLKQAIGAKVPVRTKAKLKSAAIEHMTKLEQDPDRVMAFSKTNSSNMLPLHDSNFTGPDLVATRLKHRDWRAIRLHR